MPITLTEKLKFRSLRSRYAAVAVMMAMLLSLSTILAGHFASTAQQDSSTHLLERKHFLQKSRYVHNSLLDIEKALQVFLLDPHASINIQRLKTSHATSLKATKNLLSEAWLEKLGQSGNMQQFYTQLSSLQQTFDHLIETRLQANKQYPALIYARGEMLPLHTNFYSSINLALDELQEQESLDRETYQKLLRARHLWTQMISNFRMYLANRLGSFDEATLPIQQRDIETSLNAIHNIIEQLARRGARIEHGLQTQETIVVIDSLLQAWRDGFAKVVEIHASDAWRVDVTILKQEINPVFNDLWKRLQHLDISLDFSIDVDIEHLAEVNHFQNRLIWGIFVIGLLFIIIGYFVLDRILLTPMGQVAAALNAEAHGRDGALIPAAKTIETQNLIEAFNEMRKQIHSRQSALEYQALHDSLTGLANRHLLFDRLQQGIQHARRHHQSLALYMLDLDRFKEINDTLGHQVGDRLLEEVGQRLIHTLRDIDTVARLGGDEFAILIEGCDEFQAQFVAGKILSAFEQSYQVDSLHLYLGVSIGIALYPQHDITAQGLIQRADVAMYVAKRNKTGFSFYDPELDQHSISRLAIGSDLRDAINHDRGLMLFYQPKVDLHSNKVTDVEALLRWNHIEEGLILPNEIIPLSEQTSLIQPLTYWVVEQAIKQYQEWSRMGMSIRISINISVVNLQDKPFVKNIKGLLQRYQAHGDFLIFEVTESAMMVDPAHVVSVITKLNKLGIRFSIDDFGTGFSSLSYLKQLPAHELKIDKSFVFNMIQNENDAVIVRSIIELAHNLGLRVVAEGVESQDALNLLQVLQCDAVQGFFLQRPTPATDLTPWLLKNSQQWNNLSHA